MQNLLKAAPGPLAESLSQWPAWVLGVSAAGDVRAGAVFRLAAATGISYERRWLR